MSPSVRVYNTENPALVAHKSRPSEDLHTALDAAVLAAYGFSTKKDVLAQLLELNLAVAQRIEKGEAVTPPGVPSNYPEPKNLVTRDCIAPANPGHP